MELKRGYYTFLDGKIIEMLSVENGFEYSTMEKSIIDKYNFSYDGYSYRLPVSKINNESAFKVSNYCLYKGLKFFIDNSNENELLLRPASADAEIFLGFKPYSYQASEASIVIDIENVSEIWEEREPIEGFKFDVDSIKYLKKNGKWLNTDES